MPSFIQTSRRALFKSIRLTLLNIIVSDNCFFEVLEKPNEDKKVGRNFSPDKVLIWREIGV